MVKSQCGPPMTLGDAAAAHVRLIVWCLDCRHQVEPDPSEMAEPYGAEATVSDWHKRLACGAVRPRGSARVVVSRGRRRRIAVLRFIHKRSGLACETTA